MSSLELKSTSSVLFLMPILEGNHCVFVFLIKGANMITFIIFLMQRIFKAEEIPAQHIAYRFNVIFHQIYE